MGVIVNEEFGNGDLGFFSIKMIGLSGLLGW